MNNTELDSLLFDLSMSVTAIIPIGWNNLGGHLSDEFTNFLEKDPSIISEALNLGEEGQEFLAESPTALGRLDALADFSVNGFLCVLQGRVFERSGPDCWSSTCMVAERYAYASTIEDVPAVVAAAAELLEKETYPGAKKEAT